MLIYLARVLMKCLNFQMTVITPIPMTVQIVQVTVHGTMLIKITTMSMTSTSSAM